MDTAADPVAAFWALHADLPRQGPGSDATTRALLRLAGELPAGPRALDIGCGPGRSAVVLAEAGATVTALDLHLPFLEQARRAAAARGLAITVVNASMDALPHPDGSFDLLWSEGAAYVMGVDAALREWRRLLRPGGRLVFTEVGWNTGRPSTAAREFWAAYPGMRTPEATVAAAEAAGFDVLATHRLPESDWWPEYYEPLSARLAGRREPGPAVAAVLAGTRAEIDLRREHAADYDYTGFVLRLG